MRRPDLGGTILGPAVGMAHLGSPLGSPVCRPFLDCCCCERVELAHASSVTGRVGGLRGAGIMRGSGGGEAVRWGTGWWGGASGLILGSQDLA